MIARANVVVHTVQFGTIFLQNEDTILFTQADVLYATNVQYNASDLKTPFTQGRKPVHGSEGSQRISRSVIRCRFPYPSTDQNAHKYLQASQVIKNNYRKCAKLHRVNRPQQLSPVAGIASCKIHKKIKSNKKKQKKPYNITHL